MKLENYLTEHPKKHIIFDFDGVIFTFDWACKESILEYRRRIWEMVEKIDPSLLDLVEDMGTSASYALTDLAIGKYGDSVKKEIFEFIKTKEKTILHTAKSNMDVVEFIKNNADKYTYYVWSNNVTNTLLEVLKTENLVDYFKLIVGRDQVDFAKPNTGGFDLIFNPKIHQKSDFVMVGDFKTDEIAAERAGIDFVYYP